MYGRHSYGCGLSKPWHVLTVPGRFLLFSTLRWTHFIQICIHIEDICKHLSGLKGEYENLCKNRCQESSETIPNETWKRLEIIKNDTLMLFGVTWAAVRFENMFLEQRRSLRSTILAPLGRFGAPFWRALDFERLVRKVFLEVFDAVTKARHVFLTTVPQKQESANKDKHEQNEVPIHLASLYVSAFHESAQGSILHKILAAFWRRLFDYGCRLGAHWILKGSQHRPFPFNSQHKMIKKNL